MINHSKIQLILPWLIITTTIVLIFNILLMWRVVRETNISAQEEYKVFQNDLFQHGLFISKSIMTVNNILNQDVVTADFYSLKKKLDVNTRAILGQQNINIQIYSKIIDRLPDNDPLLLKDQIVQLRPKLVKNINMISALNLKIKDAESLQTLTGLINNNVLNLRYFLAVLQDSLNVHAQVESSFFKILRNNNSKTIATLTHSLNLLLVLIAFVVFFIVFYLLEQKKNKEFLEKINEDLERKIEERTQELSIANENLKDEIIERKRSLKELSHSKADLTKAQRIACLGSWKYDAARDRIEWSDELYRIFGLSRKEHPYLTYEALLKFIHPEDIKYSNEITKKIRDEGEAEFEFRIFRGDGEIRTVLGQGKISHDDNDSPLLLIGTLQDITERKKTEQLLRESEERYRTIYNCTPAMMHSIDDKGKLISVSDYWCKKMGFSRNEVIGINSTDFLTDESRKQAKEVYLPQYFKDGHIFDVPYQYVTKNGEILDVLLSAISETTSDGKIEKSLTVLMDVTEKKVLEATLHQAQKMESIGNLAGGIAHEFNNILSIIIGNNELIMEELSEWNPLRESSKEIQVASLRARDIVKQLLTFSRQDNAQRLVIDINPVVRESMQLIRSSIPTNIEIQQNFSENIFPVLANETQINQILINLCSNAADALQEKGGIISIEIHNEIIDQNTSSTGDILAPGTYVTITVRDNGTGIDKETLKNIFDPYFTTKKIGEGTGIGLAVVHGIVERHGGKIDVESQLGKGTCFTIRLPVYNGPVEKVPRESMSLPGGSESILVVDDEPALSKLAGRHLKNLGYSADSVTDPHKAIEMIQADPQKYDLIMTDMAMPKMTGDQLIAEIKKIRPDMPTIICTGYSLKMSANKALERGINASVMKPLVKSDLARKIREVLDERP